MCTVPLDIKIHLMICSIKCEYYVCLISCLYGCDVVSAVSRCIVRPSYIRVYLTGRRPWPWHNGFACAAACCKKGTAECLVVGVWASCVGSVGMLKRGVKVLGRHAASGHGVKLHVIMLKASRECLVVRECC